MKTKDKETPKTAADQPEKATQDQAPDTQDTQEPPELPEYRCHKVVRGGKIIEIDYGIGALTLKIPDSASDSGRLFKQVQVVVGQTYMDKHKPEIGGYYLLYEDGYESWSPAKAFEDGYSLLERSEQGHMIGGDLIGPFNREFFMREKALRAANNAHRLEEPAAAVKRAEVYLAFLKGEIPAAE